MNEKRTLHCVFFLTWETWCGEWRCRPVAFPLESKVLRRSTWGIRLRWHFFIYMIYSLRVFPDTLWRNVNIQVARCDFFSFFSSILRGWPITFTLEFKVFYNVAKTKYLKLYDYGGISLSTWYILCVYSSFLIPFIQVARWNWIRGSFIQTFSYFSEWFK